MKNRSILVILAILLNLNIFAKEKTITLKKQPLDDAPTTGQLTKNTPFEIRMDEWVYVKNLNTQNSGWVKKSDLESFMNKKFYYRSRYQFGASTKSIDEIKKHQKQMQKLIFEQQREQEKLTEEFLKNFDDSCDQ